MPTTARETPSASVVAECDACGEMVADALELAVAEVDMLACGWDEDRQFQGKVVDAGCIRELKSAL